MNRRHALAAGLAATLLACAAVALQSEGDPTIEPAAEPVARSAVRGATGAPRNASPAPRHPWPAPTAEASAAWGPAAPDVEATAAAPVLPTTAAPAAEPAEPAVPPLPYQWIGTLDDGDRPQALLAGGSRMLALHAGEVLDGTWRLEHVDPTRLQWTWLPGPSSVTTSAR